MSCMYTTQGEYTCSKKMNIENFAEPLPKGSYIDSCRKCEYNKEQDKLKCRCGDGHGKYLTRHIIVDNCQNIENIRGNLRCGDPKK